MMEMDLTPHEIRVLGCLLEKEITTPEQYPLSLNALLNACNQKSNRDPVMELDEDTVQRTLDELSAKRLVREESGFGSRVPKYRHRFCNTEFGSLKLSPQELAIICTLFLRGPQTPGELRNRSSRLCQFGDIQAVESTLEGLQQHGNGQLVAQLPREPGRRECRYGHMFSGQPSATVDAGAPAVAAVEYGSPSEQDERLTELERLVAQMRAELDELKQQMTELLE